MKMISTLLADFIQDFNLESAETGVCFDAVIDFDVPGQRYNFKSPVQLESILSNQINTIYLLNPIADIYKLPTCFNDANHQFIYFKNRGIFVAGYMSLFGAYSISIFPSSTRCSKATSDELKSKRFN